ncbi:MAG: c-type cytochrome domain-containing protein [Nannocystales bacterium]
MKRIAEKLFLVPVCGVILIPGCRPVRYEGERSTDEGENSSRGEDGPGDASGEDGGDAPTDSGWDDDASTGGGDPGSCDTEKQWAMGFLSTHCGACHAGGASQGNFDYVDDFNQLLSSGKIVAGDAAASVLFARIDAGSMPPQGIEPQPNADQVARLGDFIDVCTDGGQDLDCDNEVIGNLELLREIQDDITFVDTDDRPFTRYLTLTHLHNAGLCGEDLQAYRDATAKLVNALSTEAIIEAPVAIDAAETIFRIDLRDYGWDQPVGAFSDKWEALVDSSPYAFERLEDEAETIKVLIETSIPMLQADAFIDIASQPPLYHDLAGVPDTLQELEQLLALNIEDNVFDEEVVRSGLLDSGVSRQNRIIERHEIPLAANRVMWVSYDFEDDSLEEQNIFASPLDFQEAGGEVIFSLPNGLHAYMLTDAAGNRLDVAPDAIVTDPSQEDQNVRNGISCFGCHPQLLPALDSVRDYVLTGVEFDAQTKDTVDRIYPVQSEVDEIIQADTTAFQGAVSATGVDPGLTLEPISDTFARFQLNVSLEVAAAELGIAPATLATQLGGLEPALSPLVNSTIKRDTWTSLFANTVCRLKLGLADDPQCAVVEEE